MLVVRQVLDRLSRNGILKGVILVLGNVLQAQAGCVPTWGVANMAVPGLIMPGNANRNVSQGVFHRKLCKIEFSFLGF
jgi:hypothetical protein